MRDAFAQLSQWPQWLASPVLERLTLVLNHVLRSEPAATARLMPYAGRRLQVHLDRWPALLPPPPPMGWLVTRAGLLEWAGAPAVAGTQPAATEAPPDLRIVIDARNPAALMARAMTGERPDVQIEGDAQLAAEVGWLLQNLRWDVAADLERLFGPVVAHQLHQAGRAMAGGLRAALDAWARARPPGAAGELGARLGEAATKAATKAATSAAKTAANMAASLAPDTAARFTSGLGPGRH